MAKKRTQKSIPKKFTHYQYQLVGAIILFSLSAWLVGGEVMADWERTVFGSIYGLPDALTPVFLAVTQLGGIMMLFAISAVYLFKSHYAAVVHLLMSGLLAYLAAGVAKDLLGRGRPHEFFSDLVYRDALIRGPGFPSGHMALATAIGFTLWHYLPRRHRWWAPALIVGVGLSRVYLGAHAPMDIVGGFAIGWAAVTIFHFVRITDIRKP